MARIEKTVFISYRRTDVYTALAVYENLKNQGYDVFFDYRSISSGDFEQIISSNIRARAHFLLILTPTALDRCNEPGDWLRREIEIAIDEKRNIIPLVFKGFRFGDPSVTEKLTGKLKSLSRYNGLNVHEDYFDEAMHRLRTQYLSIPLDTVLHPVSTEVQKVVREEQVAADKALEQIEDVQELVKGAEVKLHPPMGESDSMPIEIPSEKRQEEKEIEKSVPAPSIPMEEGRAREKVQLGFPSQWKSFVKRINSRVLAIGIIISFLIISGITFFLTMENQIVGFDEMVLIHVPAGEFTMGLDSGNADEQPAHTVYVDDFSIDETEVSNAMYARCVSAGTCSLPTDTTHYEDPDYANHPVVYVSWNQAAEYCA